MTSEPAKAEIDRLMSEAIDELEADAAADKLNYFLARLLGGVAGLVGSDDLTERVETLISRLSVADSLRGSISSFDWRDLDHNRHKQSLRIQPLDDFRADHPVCDHDSLVFELARFARGLRHLELCLHGDVAGALQAAQSELECEEIASTLVVLGKIDEGLELIDSQRVSHERQRRVRFVVLLEKCRQLVPSFADDIARFDPKGYERADVVLALARRRPWVGYPYPDY